MKKRVHERAFLEGLRKRVRSLKPSPLRLGLGDDAAILRPRSGFEALLTCDLLLENVHFDLSSSSPRELGAKAIAASLSDIAAMGGDPKAYLVSLGIPRRAKLGPAFFKAFYEGMQSWALPFGAELAGGDTCLSPRSLVVDVFLWGEVKRGRSLLRSGARAGDLIYCSGFLGLAAAGLETLRLQARSSGRRALQGLKVSRALRRHRTPLPRLAAGQLLSRQGLASACIDVSDGLASELHHLARESGVGIDLLADAVPLDPQAQALAQRLNKDPLEWALSGGEDYELLFTVPREKAFRLERAFRKEAGCHLSRIGEVRAGQGVRILREKRWERLGDKGYEHHIF